MCKSSNSQYNRDQGRSQYNCIHAALKCYYCEGDHHLKNCEKFSKDKAKYKLKSVDMFQKCKDKIMQQAKKENVSINKAAFAMAQESTYSVEEAEQLLGNMHFSGSDSELEWLDQYIRVVTIDEVNLDNLILYMVKVNNLEEKGLYNTDASISVMSRQFLKNMNSKPKLIKCTRKILGAGGEALVPAGKCFIQLQIGKKNV